MDAIKGVVGTNSIGEAKKELRRRGFSAELPPPSIGYVGEGEFHTGSPGANLLNEWATYSLREGMGAVIYTKGIGRFASGDTFICQIPRDRQAGEFAPVDGVWGTREGSR